MPSGMNILGRKELDSVCAESRAIVDSDGVAARTLIGVTPTLKNTKNR